MDVTKPYKFIGLGAMYVTKLYKCIGFGFMDVTKLCLKMGLLGNQTGRSYPQNHVESIQHGPKIEPTLLD
jgi:hypothetical protein